MGLDPQIIADLEAAITAGRWALWRHGHLVHVEGNFNIEVEIKSARKTFHAATVGVALYRGWIPSINQPISVWNPELTGNDALATWFHVLSQTSAFDEPALLPGELWAYSDANPIQLNNALARVWGKVDFFDSYGEGNHGSLVNNPSRVAGIFGQALEFDGAVNYASIPDSASLDFSSWSGATVALWVKPERLNHSEDQTLYGQWANSKNQRSFQLILKPNNRFQCRTNDSDGIADSTSLAAQGGWTHVVAVWTPGGLTLYINGVAEAIDSNVQSTLDSSSRSHTLGVRDKRGSLSQYFQGALDELYIYNRALSDAEIQELFLGGL